MVKIYDYNLLIKYAHISFIWSTVIKIKSHTEKPFTDDKLAQIPSSSFHLTANGKDGN